VQATYLALRARQRVVHGSVAPEFPNVLNGDVESVSRSSCTGRWWAAAGMTGERRELTRNGQGGPWLPEFPRLPGLSQVRRFDRPLAIEHQGKPAKSC